MTRATGFIDDFGMDTITLAGSLENKLKAMREAGFGQVMLKANDIVGHEGGVDAAVRAVKAGLKAMMEVASLGATLAVSAYPNGCRPSEKSPLSIQPAEVTNRHRAGSLLPLQAPDSPGVCRSSSNGRCRMILVPGIAASCGLSTASAAALMMVAPLVPSFQTHQSGGHGEVSRLALPQVRPRVGEGRRTVRSAGGKAGATEAHHTHLGAQQPAQLKRPRHIGRRVRKRATTNGAGQGVDALGDAVAVAQQVFRSAQIGRAHV